MKWNSRQPPSWATYREAFQVLAYPPFAARTFRTALIVECARNELRRQQPSRPLQLRPREFLVRHGSGNIGLRLGDGRLVRTRIDDEKDIAKLLHQPDLRGLEDAAELLATSK